MVFGRNIFREAKVATYIIAGLANTPKIETVLKEIRQVVLSKVPRAEIPKTRTHVTIAPPFEAGYEYATGLNIGLLSGEARIRRKNKAFGLTYSVRGIGWFRFGETDVLHLPINLGRELNEVAVHCREILGDKFKYPLPDEGIWHPHFTVASGPGLQTTIGEEVSDRNWIPRPIRGVVSQIVLLAKYRGFGYDYLSYDPDQET